MIDLNVILDVVQKRVPHYDASATVLSAVRLAEFEAYIPSHAVTTIHYLVAKFATKRKANSIVDWLLRYFQIATVDKSVFLRARKIPLSDFEDAVVASMAEHSASNFIVTRNIANFRNSPVAAITPEEFLAMSDT
jgi:predicted nucleic acid-binding protein